MVNRGPCIIYLCRQVEHVCTHVATLRKVSPLLQLYCSVYYHWCGTYSNVHLSVGAGCIVEL